VLPAWLGQKKHCAAAGVFFTINFSSTQAARFAMGPQKASGSKNRKATKGGGRKKGKAVLRHTVEIINSLGLHARPSALFVQTANQFPHCTITVSNGFESVDGRSIMGIMTLAAAQGTELTLEIAGEQAEETMEALCRLIANKFDEE
jgi:phosphocarrier protein